MADDMQSHLAGIAGCYALESIYVFGSRAEEIADLVAGAPRPAQAPGSDVDIGVQPRWGVRVDAEERVSLTLALEDLLAVGRVDLVILPEANPLLAAEVVRGELLYTEDADAEAESQLYYLRRVGDLAPFYRQQWRDLMGSER